MERGLWATHRNNEAKLNDAFDSCDHVLLVFSVNETRHFQVRLSSSKWTNLKPNFSSSLSCEKLLM